MTPRYVWMRPILGLIITAGFLGALAYLTYKIFFIGFDQVAKEILVLWAAAFQALILMVKDGFGFYFGTSQGSANKAETIDKMVNGLAPPPTEPPTE